MESLSLFWLGVIILGGIGTVVTLTSVKSKAVRALVLLLLVGAIGIGWRVMSPPHIQKPFTNSAALTSATQTIDGQGRIAVRPTDSQADLFQYFQTNGAASLSTVQPLNASEWVAIFSATSSSLGVGLGVGKAPALERRYRGWFETPVNDSNETLPLVKSYQAVSGELRVEDASSGETIFMYQANAAFKPVAIVKQTERAKGTSWQIIFSNQLGMLSQK